MISKKDDNPLLWDHNEETKKKSISPNSIYFYLKKFDNDIDKAENALKIYRNKMKGKLKPKSTLDYWLWKGYSQEESEKLRKEWTKQHSSRIGKLPRSKSPYQGEVDNYIKNGFSKKEAIEKANERRRRVSPRRKEYWIGKGFSDSDSEKKVKEWQRLCSPRTIEHWINKGLSESEAVKKVSEYQDTLSIESICKRLSCSKEEAAKVQLKYIEKQRISCNDLDDEIKGLFYLYKEKVNKLTRINYRLYKHEIDPRSKRNKEYHLDHIYSIKEGFVNSIPIEVIASKYNLRVIHSSENSKKQDKCGMSLRQLVCLYEFEKEENNIK